MLSHCKSVHTHYCINLYSFTMWCFSAPRLKSLDLVLTSTAQYNVRHKSRQRGQEKPNLLRGRKSREVGGEEEGGEGGGWVSPSLQSPLILSISKRFTPSIKYCQDDMTHSTGGACPNPTFKNQKEKRERKKAVYHCKRWTGKFMWFWQVMDAQQCSFKDVFDIIQRKYCVKCLPLRWTHKEQDKKDTRQKNKSTSLFSRSTKMTSAELQGDWHKDYVVWNSS